MTREQLLQFQELGYLRVPRAVDTGQLAPVRAYVVGELKKLKLWPGGGGSKSHPIKALPAFQHITRLGQLLRFPGLQERMRVSRLLPVMEALAGTRLMTSHDAQMLVSLPNREKWSLQRLDWHVDIKGSDPHRCPGVQLFLLIDDVAQRGGATMGLAGSHRLLQPKALYRQLREDASQPRSAEGVKLTVFEMSGRAGDAYLMDMRLLHTPSINASKQVRMMSTVRFFTAE